MPRDAQARQTRSGGTVGVVCLDADGLLAAGTSTGGMRGQLPGRVGDSPLPGAGTWADDLVAVSCTGDGEAFIRAGAARHLSTLVASGVGLEQAAAQALAEVAELGGQGGLIAVDAQGNIAMPFSSEAMPEEPGERGRSRPRGSDSATTRGRESRFDAGPTRSS